jgi:hypothetical protein
LPELQAALAILRGMGWPLAVVFVAALLLAIGLPVRRRHKAAGVVAVLLVPLLWLASDVWRVHEAREFQAQARVRFEARCRTAAVRINRTVEDVEGVLLIKRRSPAANLGNQYALTDPYGDDLSGDGYALTFLWGRDEQGHVESTAPAPLGYRYVVIANEDGRGYTRFEAGTGERGEGGVLPVLRTPAEHLPRYGVTWQDISTRDDRDHWIAGSRLLIVDTSTGEVLAERIGWMWDEAMGAGVGARHPWSMAAARACPPFPVTAEGHPDRVGQTRSFAERVLQPRREAPH